MDDTTSSTGPSAPTGADDLDDGITVARSARVLGRLWAGPRTYLAQGAIIRSLDGVELGHNNAVLEGCVVIGTAADPVRIGRKTVFGHRCTVIGAEIGDLCEIGNASVLLPGSSVGTGCFLGERTLVPAGQRIPPGSVAVGQPARVIRAANEADQRRLLGLRAGDLRLHEGAAAAPTRGGSGAWAASTPTGASSRPSARARCCSTRPRSPVTSRRAGHDHRRRGQDHRGLGTARSASALGVQILENAVLHLLPDNDLLIEDDVIIGPNTMIHGCHIGAGTVVEPAATVCDHAVIGAGVASSARAASSSSAHDRRSQRDRRLPGGGRRPAGRPAAAAGLAARRRRPAPPPRALVPAEAGAVRLLDHVELLGVVPQVGGHERAERHDREPPVAHVVERAGREVEPRPCPSKAGSISVWTRVRRPAIGPVDELTGELAVDAQLVARVRRIVDDRDLGLPAGGGHGRQ